MERTSLGFSSVHPRWHLPPLLALPLALAACAGPPPPRYPIRDSSRVLASLRARQDHLTSLRATGSADQFGRQGRVRGSVMIYVRQPDKIRVEVWAFGNLVQSVVSNGQEFSLLQGHQFVVGPARACVAAQLMGIALDGHDVVTVLTGGAPLIGDVATPPRWENGRYVFDVTGAAGARERIELELPAEQHDLPPERQEPRLRRVVLYDARGEKGEITYNSYRVVSGVAFPDRVRIVMPRDHVDTELRFDEVQPNFTVPADPNDPESAPPDPFQQSQPAGTQRTPLNC